MKKQFLFSSLLICAMVLIQSLAYANERTKSVNWKTDFQQAIQESQNSEKPILLFFTGSDWCSWCKKLDAEVFDTPTFAQEVGNLFIFVKVDFPMQSQQDPQLKEQNKQLQKKFNIRSFPQVVILDPQQRQIGTAGYRPGGAKQYSEFLKQYLSRIPSSHMQ